MYDSNRLVTVIITGGGGVGDSYIRRDRGAVSEGMLMDQTIRENMSKTDQRFRVNVVNVTNMTG